MDHFPHPWRKWSGSWTPWDQKNSSLFALEIPCLIYSSRFCFCCVLLVICCIFFSYFNIFFSIFIHISYVAYFLHISYVLHLFLMLRVSEMACAFFCAGLLLFFMCLFFLKKHRRHTSFGHFQSPPKTFLLAPRTGFFSLGGVAMGGEAISLSPTFI